MLYLREVIVLLLYLDDFLMVSFDPHMLGTTLAGVEEALKKHPYIIVDNSTLGPVTRIGKGLNLRARMIFSHGPTSANYQALDFSWHASLQLGFQ